MPNYFNTSLKNLTNRLRSFKPILEEELKNEILANESVIIKMVVENQLFNLGIDGRGKSIISYKPYSPSTIKRKIKKAQPYDRVTLKDTGMLYASLHVKFDKGGFYITSTDDKAPYLLKKYGTTIFRLTDENLTILLRDYIAPSLKEKMKQYIKNGRT